MIPVRLFIFGLDAATWDLLNPWIAEGALPNLGRLVANGASGPLQSTIPPLTPPAWTSFMTGCNPGRHGIYNFMEPQPGSYVLRYSNAGSRKTESFWKLLNNAGLTAGVINVPFTYPPEPIAGFQISGMDAPSVKSAFIHPPEFRCELEREFGALDLEIRYLGAMSTNARRDVVLEGMRKLDEQWTRVALHAVTKRPCNVMMVTFMSIDTVQHYFWHYMDSAHFLHDPCGATRYRDAIKDVYRRLDASIGRILEHLPADCTVLAVSDHGAGPVSDRIIYLNRYLAQLGLLAYKKAERPLLLTLIRGIRNFVRGQLSSNQKRWLADLGPLLRESFENAATGFSDIDWSRTKAYCSEVLAYPPSVSLNMRGEKPAGIVAPSDREALLQFLIEKMSALEDPRDGSRIIPRIYRREELFRGEFAAQGPDLVLDWWSGAGFSASPSLPEDISQPVVKIRERSPMKGPEWSGTHRMEGIFAIRGPAFTGGSRAFGVRLFDLMPTLLHFLDVPVPAGIDGRVLTEIFDAAWLHAHPIRQSTCAQQPSAAQNSPYSAEEAAEVENRLKALGYVD